jgi:hypothetical protein
MTEIAKRLLPALAVAAALAPVAASAQLYKCKGPDGKTVYSDSKCEASEAGALKVTPMATTPSAREKAAAEAAKEASGKGAASTLSGAAPSGDASSTVTQSAGSASTGAYKLTSSDEERLRNLDVGRTRMGATAEQKTAMELEMRQIRSGRDAHLSSDARSRREALHSDLASSDAQKRKKALSDFRALYN